MKIFNKDSEIISSGTIISSKNDFIEFQIPDSDLKFRFRFLDSKEEGAFSKAEFIKEENNKETMEIHLFNFDTFDFTGNPEPYKLATINNKELSIKLRVNFIGKEKTDIIFHYSWLLSRKEVTNG